MIGFIHVQAVDVYIFVWLHPNALDRMCVVRRRCSLWLWFVATCMLVVIVMATDVVIILVSNVTPAETCFRRVGFFPTSTLDFTSPPERCWWIVYRDL